MKVESKIIDLIYDVPLGSGSWLPVMEALQREMQSILGLMFLIKPNEPPTIITTTSENDPLFTPYNAYYAAIDPWNELLGSIPSGESFIHSGFQLLPEKQFYNSEYYNDFWKLFGLGETIGGTIPSRIGVVIQLGFPRDNKTPNYNESDTLLLRFYSAHIKKVIELEGFLGVSLPNQAYEQGLKNTFGLTASESKLTISLFKTSSLQASAIELNRSYHTVRAQLKSIFDKTDTQSQLQLMKKMKSNSY